MLTDQDTGDEQALPAPPRECPISSWLAPALRAHADGLASMYGGPIWMVGSALQLEDPGDVDLRCVLEEHDWRRLFGGLDQHGQEKERTRLRRYREELKQSRRLARGFRYRFDFQFQSRAAFKAKHGPRVRIDAVPDYVFAAGLGDP